MLQAHAEGEQIIVRMMRRDVLTRKEQVKHTALYTSYQEVFSDSAEDESKGVVVSPLSPAVSLVLDLFHRRTAAALNANEMAPGLLVKSMSCGYCCFSC